MGVDIELAFWGFSLLWKPAKDCQGDLGKALYLLTVEFLHLKSWGNRPWHKWKNKYFSIVKNKVTGSLECIIQRDMCR